MADLQDVPEYPSPEALRAWLSAALLATELRPAPLAQAIGGGVNTVSAFLKTPGRDIKLSRARALVSHVRAVAAEKGVVLPPLGDPARGTGHG